MSGLQFADLLLVLVSLLVNTPEKVEVSFTVCEENYIFVVTVNEGEQGQLIGKDGQIIMAIRTILRSIACNQNTPKIFVDVANYVPKNTQEPKSA